MEIFLGVVIGKTYNYSNKQTEYNWDLEILLRQQGIGEDQELINSEDIGIYDSLTLLIPPIVAGNNYACIPSLIAIITTGIILSCGVALRKRRSDHSYVIKR